MFHSFSTEYMSLDWAALVLNASVFCLCALAGVVTDQCAPTLCLYTPVFLTLQRLRRTDSGSVHEPEMEMDSVS